MRFECVPFCQSDLFFFPSQPLDIVIPNLPVDIGDTEPLFLLPFRWLGRYRMYEMHGRMSDRYALRYGTGKFVFNLVW